MTDLRRIELSSVKTSEKEPKVKRKVKTVRLVLSLGESNATSCPEYSFADLIKAENDKSNENLDPFGDNDEEREVAAIAQRFEAKYGTKSLKSGKKQQTQDMDDYYDVGDGYDEDDPFIDNTEAYDEVVPSTLTTKYGGFYINQGKLDFKSISEDSNDSFAVEDKSKKKLKRKQLDSDSEDETPEAIAKKFKAMKRKKLLEGREAEKKKKKLGISLNGDVSIIKKKKKKNLLKLKQASRDSLPKKEDNSSSVSVLPKQATTTAPVVTTAPAVTTTPPVPPATATSTSVVTNVSTTVSTLNGNNNMSTNEEKSSVVEDVSMKEPANVVINIDDSSSKSGDEEKKPEATNEEKNTQLPSSLPPKLAEDIAKIKQLAKMSTESKSKFFSGNTNKLLLTIENESFKLSKSDRSAIFHHLAEHLPTSGKTALLRRAKKLRQAQYETPLKVPLEKLREAVKLAMPKAIEEHQLIIAKAKLEAKSNGADTTTEDAATESDEDENKTADTKKTRMPRRKFSWTLEIIDLFLKVVEVKMGVYNTLKSKPQPPDEYLKAFFEAEVKPIWPNNWMNTRALLKLHREETSKGVKKRNVSGKMSPVPSSDPPLNPSQQLVSKMNSIMEVSNKKGGDIEESKRSNNICMTDDIIEISSIIDDDVEEKKNVVINLPDSDVKSSLPIMNLQQSQSRSTSSVPSSTTNTPPGQMKTESKAIPNKSSSSTSLGTVSDHLYNSVKKLPDKTGMGNMASQPIVVPESPKPQPATPLRMGTVISTPIPKAASTPVLTGSGSNTVTTSSIPLNNRSFLHALDPPTLHKEGPLPSKPHVSLLSPQQQQQQQQKSTSNLLNTVLQSYQPQQKQLPKKFQPSPSSSSSSSQIRNNIQLPTKTGSSLSLQHQQEQQKIRPSKESKLTLMPPKSTISSYPVVNSSINTSSPSNKDLLNPVVRATPIPATTLAAYKQAASLSITNKGLGAAASQANHQGNNKLSFANQQQQHQQSQPQQKPPFNLSTQQQKQKQFQVVKQAGGQGQSQITVVSPPNSQLQQTNRKSNSAAINTSPLANSGGTPKQSPMRQQQKSPLPSSPHSASNYIASKNNQFMLNNKSSPVNALQSSLPAGSQVKSGIVLGTTLPKFKPQSNSPNISRNSNNSATKPLTIQTSTFSAPSISPSSIFSLSRTSTPSPQKSPGSPGITASSLLDHIQSQMLKEATQDQGLKVLAMAMNIEGKPKLGQGSSNQSPSKFN